ncbi:hypothetical protein HDU86_003711 [Geranomyces michiganensis]|nr:hypothetical protein HDU86_003711 [Geranomyces michiganensis]
MRKFSRPPLQPRDFEVRRDRKRSADVSGNLSESIPRRENAGQLLDTRYELVVRQQPQRARMSGYNHRDRRPVDPTPIVQLIARTSDGTQVEINFAAYPFLILHASLWSADGLTEHTGEAKPVTHLQNDPGPRDRGSDASLHTPSSAATIADLPPRVPAPKPDEQRHPQQQNYYNRQQQPQQQPHDLEDPSPTQSSPHTDRRPSISTYNGDTSTPSTSAGGGPSPTDHVRPPSPSGDGLPPPPSSPILLGSLVSECHVLRDEEGVQGLYFVFPDIGVRTSGRYRLKFNLFVIELFDKMGNSSNRTFAAEAPLADQSSSHLSRASVYSNVFKVYSPKGFPGMAASTTLSTLFAQQGIRIHLRSDTHTKQQQRAPESPTTEFKAESLTRTNTDASIETVGS